MNGYEWKSMKFDERDEEEWTSPWVGCVTPKNMRAFPRFPPEVKFHFTSGWSDHRFWPRAACNGIYGIQWHSRWFKMKQDEVRLWDETSHVTTFLEGGYMRK